MANNQVTLRDILEACNRLEDKFDRRLSTIETDVNTLQAFQNRTLGILSLLTAFVGIISSYIWNRLTGKS